MHALLEVFALWPITTFPRVELCVGSPWIRNAKRQSPCDLSRTAISQLWPINTVAPSGVFDHSLPLPPFRGNRGSAASVVPCRHSALSRLSYFCPHLSLSRELPNFQRRSMASIWALGASPCTRLVASGSV